MTRLDQIVIAMNLALFNLEHALKELNENNLVESEEMIDWALAALEDASELIELLTCEKGT
jgi:DNA-binding transcriptional ArsR family regulator